VRPLGARHTWLSITPEPELELPKALATLRAGGPPSAAQVELERVRAERLVTHGSRRAWRRYLAEALALAGSSEDEPVAEARAVVEDVVHNHNQLELAL
jgi:PhoPQ-activated pathogenicity-related protein